jgi:phage tail protein X
MKAYRTTQGDTWDVVALRMYPNLGGEKLMHTLIETNPAYRETVVFEANVMLRIPDVDIPVVSSLPPWKRR